MIEAAPKAHGEKRPGYSKLVSVPKAKRRPSVSLRSLGDDLVDSDGQVNWSAIDEIDKSGNAYPKYVHPNNWLISCSGTVSAA